MKTININVLVATIAAWGVVLAACITGVRILGVVVVSTGSMQSTLVPGDRLLINKLSYTRLIALSNNSHEDPKVGDIIMFRLPLNTSQIYIKRIVGVPGDRLRMIGPVLYSNGNRVIEPYTHQVSPNDPYRDNFPNDSTPFDRGIDGELVIPPNNYFVMGDNRSNSFDSRYWGVVPWDYIVGKPMLIYWSPQPSRLFHVFHTVCGVQTVNEQSCFVQ